MNQHKTDPINDRHMMSYKLTYAFGDGLEFNADSFKDQQWLHPYRKSVIDFAHASCRQWVCDMPIEYHSHKIKVLQQKMINPNQMSLTDSKLTGADLLIPICLDLPFEKQIHDTTKLIEQRHKKSKHTSLGGDEEQMSNYTAMDSDGEEE